MTKKKKKKMLPTSGEVNLVDFCRRLTPGCASETYYHEDTDVEAPDPPDYGRPTSSTRVKAGDLWLLLSLAVEGALEQPEEEFEGREEEVLEFHVRRLEAYLKTSTFVSLLRREPQGRGLPVLGGCGGPAVHHRRARRRRLRRVRGGLGRHRGVATF